MLKLMVNQIETMMATKSTSLAKVSHIPSLQAHAINNIQYIRETMERAASFTAVPGWGMVGMGITALMAAGISSFRTDLNEWMIIWLIEAVTAICVGSISMRYKAKLVNDTLFSRTGWRFLLNLFVPILVGIPITVVFYQQDLIQYLPGLWLLLYGTGVVTGGAFSVRIIPIMGFCFIITGVFSLFSPAAWGNLFLAFGFGAIHILFGLVVAKRHGG
jgi:hypothetical protein